MEKTYVLFVCKGNICRSPTAQGIFQKLVDDENLSESIYIDSAGTHDYHIGKSPDERAQQTALKKGIDLSNLIGRQVSTEDYEKFDYILAMDNENFTILLELCPPEHKYKLALFLDFASNVSEKEVPDPYWHGGKDFKKVFEMIKSASNGLLSDIKSIQLNKEVTT